MEKMQIEYFDVLTEQEKTKIKLDAIATMKSMFETFDFYVYGAEGEWTVSCWTDPDGYVHLIPHPVSRELSVKVCDQLQHLYNTFYTSNSPALSGMTMNLEELHGIDIYQLAGTLMASSFSLHWSTCYVGPLVVVLSSCK